MLAKMFFFEWRYFIRQPSFYVTSLIFFLLTFFATISDNVQIGGNNVITNGSYSIAQTIVIMAVFALFLVVNFVASTATRNDTSKMSELLYSKPINPISYQLGRFLGSFAIVATVFTFVPLGIYIGSTIGEIAGWIDSDKLVDSNIAFYLTAYFYLALPTLFVLSCLFYAVAIRFRSMMAVYLVAIGVIIFFQITGSFLAQPDYRTIVALADPFAANTLAEITRYWTMSEKNNTVLELSGVLLQNRIIWLSIGGITLAFFGRFTHKITLTQTKEHKNANKKPKQTITKDGVTQLSNTIDYQGNGITTFSHLLLRIKFEVKQVIVSAPFLILSVLTAIMLLTQLIYPENTFGAPNWPLTQTMVQLVSGSTNLLMLIILTYYSAEIVWRDRNSGMGDIIDSAPVNNITFWLSKIIAISLVLTLLYIFGSSVTIINQLLSGYNNIELSQYVIRLGYVTLLPFLMTAILAFFIQVVSPNKYVGMMMFMLYIISTIVLSNFGFSHHMFQFAKAPDVYYSDINTYGDFLTTHSWYMLYWTGLTIVIAALTYALWQRGPVQSLKTRIKKISYYLGTTGKGAIAIGLCIFIATGSYIYYNTRVLNEYTTEEHRNDLDADYEKTYSQYVEDAIPTITKVNANIDIYPSERRIYANANITVVNNSEQEISRFLLQKPRFSKEWQVTISGGKVAEYNDKFKTAWFTFDSPLQPGESREGQFIVHRKHQGFNDGNNDFTLVENGTFINNFELFPVFGYQKSYQLVDKHERKKRDLAPVERAHKLEDSSYYNESDMGKGSGFIDFEATISTSADQFAITPGYLQSEKVENGRRTFHYKMNTPMINFYSILSARLEVKKEQHNGIAIEVYYHKSHSMNIDRMIESVKDSIDYYSEKFGPYQHKQMRIIEFPGYRGFAQSFANTVPYSEKIGFISDLRDPENIDPVYYVTAHEVAHQWWGHQVGAANVQGSAIISESLSQYSALMVMEKKYGAEKVRKFLKYELDRYLSGRSVEIIEEMPFMRSESQQYIHYNKGSVVMMSLKDKLGEQRMNIALANFFNQFKYQSSPYPTTLDLFDAITADNNVEEKAFVNRLFTQISLYDLKTTAVDVSEQADGQYKVNITVQAKLLIADGQGVETEQDFAEMIDIGLFNADPDDFSTDNKLNYMEKHLIKSGENIIELTVKEKPKFVGVDPFIKLIDRDSADNIYRL